MNMKMLSMQGKKASDERGSVRFVNGFDFSGVRRFYQVENAAVGQIRAFHGHMKEAKYVYLAKGQILLCAVHLTDEVSPSLDEKVSRFFLSADSPSVIFIPPAFANGFKSLTPDASVIFFSTATLAESQGDDYRFDPGLWGDEVWES